MDQWDIFPRQAAAVGMMAQKQGLARVEKTWDELYTEAKSKIQGARRMLDTMMEQALIADMPE
jgi:malate dehydrogenase (oxaloacetate-decarboxylating)